MNTNNNNRTPRRYPDKPQQNTAPQAHAAQSGVQHNATVQNTVQNRADSRAVQPPNDRNNINHSAAMPRGAVSAQNHRLPANGSAPIQHRPQQTAKTVQQSVRKTNAAQPYRGPMTAMPPNAASHTHSQPSQPQRPQSAQQPVHRQPQQQIQQPPTAYPTRAQNLQHPQQAQPSHGTVNTPQTQSRMAPQAGQDRLPGSAATRTYTRRSLKNNPPTHTPDGKKLTASQRHKIAKGKSIEQATSKERDNTLSSVIKAMMYIVFVIVASGFLSYYIIAIGNDVFAFVKSDEAVVVTLDEYVNTKQVAQILEENGLIKYPTVFEFYMKFRQKEDSYLSGSFTVSPSMNYDDLYYALTPKGTAREEVSITIREGLTVNEIINIFVEKGIGTREGFIDVIQNYDFDYWFIDEMGTLNPDRTYRLEGYLYPDTYYFYTDSTEYAVIKKFLDRFNEMFDERYKESCEAVGMSVDEVIILASMIQMEGKYVSEYGAISSVFHNRLNNPRAETAGFLNSDATIQYALNERKSVLTSEDTELDSPYNTYEHKGLPPGPICCPSLDAMNYAMYPDDTKYFYFVSRTNGYSLFAETAEEHTENIILARSGQ